MGKPEAYVENYLYAQAKAHQGECYKFTSGVSGVPDRILVLRGYTIFIELKALGEKPRDQQWVQIERMQKAGAEVHVIDNREDIDLLLADVMDRALPPNPNKLPTSAILRRAFKSLVLKTSRK